MKFVGIIEEGHAHHRVALGVEPQLMLSGGQ